MPWSRPHRFTEILQVIIKDYGVRSMISILGSLSFVMQKNLRGMPDARSIHPLNQDCPIQSRLQSAFFLRRTQ